MSRPLAFGVAAVALVLLVALAAQLWRSRRAGDHPWTRQDSLTAMGLLVALLGIVVPLLASGSGQQAEAPPVRSYRQEVVSACASLRPTTNPLAAALRPDGSVDRAVLFEGMRNQVLAADGVLTALWERDVPDQLAADAREAQQVSTTYLSAARRALDRAESAQPARMSMQQVSAVFGRLDAELRAATSQTESAMSRLAGAPCQLGTQPSTT